MQLLAAFLILAAASAPAQETVVETRVETVSEGSEHEIVKADTLWDLSMHFYKTPWLWPRIYEANTDRIKDPNVIYPGQVFVIPGFGKTVMVTDQEVIKPPPPPPPPPEPEPVPEPTPQPPPGEFADSDELSIELPKGMPGQTGAMPRFKMPAGWKEDGRVLDYQGKESVSAAGDFVRVEVKSSAEVRRRSRFTVYRWSARREGEDPKGIYLQRAGTIEIVRKLQDGQYRAVITAAGGSIQLDDLLKAE